MQHKGLNVSHDTTVAICTVGQNMMLERCVCFVCAKE